MTRDEAIRINKACDGLEELWKKLKIESALGKLHLSSFAIKGFEGMMNPEILKIRAETEEKKLPKLED